MMMHPCWGRLFALYGSAQLLSHPRSYATTTVAAAASADAELSRASCLDALTYADQDHDELLTLSEFWEALHQLATLLACSALQDANYVATAIDDAFDEVVCLCLTVPDVGESDPLCCPAGDGNVNSKLRLPSSSSSSEYSTYPDIYTDSVCQSMVQLLQDICRRPNSSGSSSSGAFYEPLPPPVEVSSLLDVDNNNANNYYYKQEEVEEKGEGEEEEVPDPIDTSSSLGTAEEENPPKSVGERVVGSSSPSSSLIRVITAVAVTLGVFLLTLGVICARYRRRQRIQQEQAEREQQNMENVKFGTAESSAVNVTFVSSDE